MTPGLRVCDIMRNLLSQIKEGVFHGTFYLGNEADFKAKRAMAYAEVKGKTIKIVVSRKLERKPQAVIIGVLAHEIAHALDMSTPRMKVNALYPRLPATPERRADALAERLFGIKISYDKDDIETVGPGTRPRPKRLGL